MSKIRTGSIVLDSYKLDTFKSILDRKGYNYEFGGHLTEDRVVIRFEFTDVEKAKVDIEECNEAARKILKPSANKKAI